MSRTRHKKTVRYSVEILVTERNQSSFGFRTLSKAHKKAMSWTEGGAIAIAKYLYVDGVYQDTIRVWYLRPVTWFTATKKTFIREMDFPFPRR